MPERRGEDRPGLAAPIALGLAAAASAVLLAALTSEWVLNFDDLVDFADARGFNPGHLFDPHSGHPVFTFRLIFSGLLESFGPGDYTAYSLTHSLFVALTVAPLFVLLRRRVGDLVALVPCVLLLFLGSGWTSVLGPGSLAGVLCFAPGLFALLVLDEELEGAGRQLLAGGLLVVSVMSWTGGLLFVAAVAVRILAEPGPRLRRAWMVAAPVALYALWFFWKNPLDDSGGNAAAGGVFSIFEVIAVSLSTTLAGLLGVGYDSSPRAEVHSWTGAPFALIAVVALGWRLSRGRIPPTTWQFLVLPLGYWGLLAVSSSADRMPDDPRHLFFPAIGILLVAADLLRGVELRRPAAIAILAVGSLSLVANVAMLVHRGDYLRDYSVTLRAEMAGIELAGSRVPDGFLPLEHGGEMNISAGEYREAVARYGSPVSAKRDLADSPPEVRAHVRRLLGIATAARASQRGNTATRPAQKCSIQQRCAGSSRASP